MNNRINPSWEDPRLPVEVQRMLRSRARVTALAAMTLITHADVEVYLLDVPVTVAGKRFNNLCLFVAGMLVTSLSVEEQQ